MISLNGVTIRMSLYMVCWGEFASLRYLCLSATDINSWIYSGRICCITELAAFAYADDPAVKMKNTQLEIRSVELTMDKDYQGYQGFHLQTQ
jgi:hypothetical protein